MMINKILIVNPFGIGDVIFSTPLIDILRKKFPDSFIAYICNRRVSELLGTNPNLNRIFVYEKDEYRDVWKRSKIDYLKKFFMAVRTLRAYRFDVLIDLSLAYQYSMLAKIIGIKERIGFNYRNRGGFLTKRVDINGFDEKHVIDYYLEVLSFLGIDVKKYSVSPRIYTSEVCVKSADQVLVYLRNAVADNFHPARRIFRGNKMSEYFPKREFRYFLQLRQYPSLSLFPEYGARQLSSKYPVSHQCQLLYAD